jgi:hypothetical protein
MKIEPRDMGYDIAGLSRRDWLRQALVAALPLPALQDRVREDDRADPNADHAAADQAELTAIRKRLFEAKIGPLNTVHTARYQALGDAPEAFMRLILDDCEQLAADYFKHFRARGFALHEPAGALIVVLFRDDRSFGRFFRLPSLMEAAAKGRPVQPAGIYDRASNHLHVFDWRNVPMAPRSSHRNIETLAHEGTHQLTFNTGLLNRGGDTPLCIIEGLGTYGESRKTIGPSEFGRPNLRRLEDLAKIQRRVPWIPVRELLTDDSVLRVGNAARVMLAYAQSWLLVHYLLKDATALPRFREYLKAIAARTKPTDRLADAQTHLGDLDVLDRDLKRYQVRLQLSI